MALGKAAKEFAEEIVTEAKRGGRTTFKEIETPPEGLPSEKLGEFFEKDKTAEFAEARQRDITLDERATFAKQKKLQEKLDTEVVPPERTPFPDRETYLKEEKAQLDFEAKQADVERLQEMQRDLYIKANDLKLERARTQEFQRQLDEGIAPMSAVQNQLNSQPGAGHKFDNIEGRQDAIYNRVSAGLYELKESLRTKMVGLSQNKALADDVVRFIKDGKVKDLENEELVKRISKAWIEAAEQLKNLRNKTGARIGKLEDWIMPQSHDKFKVNKAGFDKWSKDIAPKLDRARIEKEQGVSLEEVLKSAYKNITSTNVGTLPGGTGAKLTKRGEESRVLHFKNGDDIINYNGTYGNPDIFATMDSHIRQQSNEIAQMQLFGSNPEQTYNKLKELAASSGMGGIKKGYLDANWKMASGQSDGDDIIDRLDYWMAMASGTHRSLAIGGKLGSATVSSLADQGNMFLGAGYRGLNSIRMHGKGLETLLQEATTIGSVADNIRIASRIGVVSDFASASLTNTRFAETGAGWAQKSAEVVIRSSGLGSYTNSMRSAVGLELAGNFAENFNKSFDDIPFSKMMEEYGLGAKEWDMIRKSQTYKAKGAEFLDMAKIYDIDEQLGYRLSDMFTNEMNAFVIMPTNRTRVFTTWGAKKGSFVGESARNIMLFKSFPIAITMMHFARLGKIDSTMGKVAYVSKAMTTGMVMGTITLWAYDIATGKTPREANPIDRPAIMLEAISKSGALGVFGDFFIGMADTKYGNSFSDIVMGVPSSTMNDILKTAQDWLIKDLTTEQKLGNTYNRAKGYAPGQNLWYTRYLMERTVGEFMGELVDPDHQKRKRRRAKAMRLRKQEDLLD